MSECLDVKDPTLDFELQQYLRTKEVNDEYSEDEVKALIQKSKNFILENARLYILPEKKILPTITERKILLK